MTRFSVSRAARRPRITALGIGILLACALTGCASSGFLTGGAGASDKMDGLTDVASTSELALTDGRMAENPGAIGTSVIRTGDLSVEVSDPTEASLEVAKVLEPLDGRIEFSSLSAADEWSPATANLTARVPADAFEEAIDAVSAIGEVRSVSRSSLDVTLQHQDLSARVAALETSTERLRALMAEATNTADLIAAESALTERQAELDGLQSQLDSLDGQVDEATITIALHAPGTTPSALPTNFWEAIVFGVRSLGTAFVGFGLALGVALPWLVVAAIVAAIVLAIVRITRRRRPVPAPHESGAVSHPSDETTGTHTP